MRRLRLISTIALAKRKKTRQVFKLVVWFCPDHGRGRTYYSHTNRLGMNPLCPACKGCDCTTKLKQVGPTRVTLLPYYRDQESLSN